MRKAVGPLALVFLVYCSYSNAYEQQYTVGGIGPNGGTVTAVSVVPELTNTTEEMVGDFLETTYTYTYTETVDEVVNQTTYQTVTVVEEKTESLLDASTITTTNVTTNCYATDAYCTGSQSTGGGSVIYEMDASSYDNKNEIDYGSTVTSHVSNASLPPCSQTTGDCQDEFKITVTLLNNGIVEKTYTHHYASVNWSGSNDYSFNQDVSGVTFDTAKLELYGMDAGYFSGYYGPAFSNTFFDLTYDYIYQAIQQIVTQVEMQTILTANEYEYDSQYIPPPTNETGLADFGSSAGDTFQVTLEPMNGPLTTFEVEVVDSPTGDFEIRVAEVEVFEEIESFDAGGADAEPTGPRMDDSPENSEATVSEGGSEESSQTANAEEPEGEQIPVANNRERGNSGSSNTTYNTVMETVKLAVMNQSQAARGFNQYQNLTIPSVSFYEPTSLDGGRNYDNPMGMWYSGASDILWDDMVGRQYE